MATFKIRFKGYDKKQVNEYIRNNEIKQEAEKETLKKRISLLQSEINQLTAKVETSAKKERDLVDGMLKIEYLEQAAREKVERQSEIEKQRLELFKQKWSDYAVNACKKDYGGVLEVLDGYLAEYTQKVKESIEQGLDLAKPQIDASFNQDAVKLASLCRKLGILEE